MKKHLTIFGSLLIFSIAMMPARFQRSLDASTPIAALLFDLGEAKPEHFIEAPTKEAILRGEEIVKLGRTIAPNGSQSSYVSKYYTCTSCHNVVREDPDLTVVDQDARLENAMTNNIPYLQGSTFWGMVNRETWYNDDYVLKYGDLVRKAEKSLKESVHLCATVCAQGRPLEDWEMQSVLAYFWSLQMQIGDLNLSDSEKKLLAGSTLTNEEKIALVKSRYLQKSPATFVNPPDNKKKGYPYEGDPKLGKGIYELGCQHCHRPEGESDVVFDNSNLTYKWLKKHIPDNSELSIYEIIRKGTYAEYGHKEYMPHYTQEKMSDRQLEHLRAFIEHPEDAN